MSSNQLLGIVLVLPLSAAAQEPADLASRVEALERSAQRAAEAAKAQPVLSAGEQGFALETSDRAFVLKLRGLAQFDARTFPGDGALPLADTLLLRRIRPTLEATFFDLVELQLTPDFANSTVVLFDAWADFRPWPWLQLRIGKFKPPIGLERLQSPSRAHFTELASPSSLVPTRDLGIQLHGDLGDGALGYAFGVFNGGADGAVSEADPNPEKEIAGRLFTHPFRFFGPKLLENFGIGVAASFGRQVGTATAPLLPAFRSAGQQTFFAYAAGAFGNGDRVRVSPQAYLYVGPFAALAEYASSSQPVSRFGVTTPVTHVAWNTTFAFVVTGEDAAFEGVTPQRPFSFAERHFGALELVARYHVLRVDNAVFNAALANPLTAARRATAFGAGIHWHLNRNLKVSAVFERTWFLGGATPIPLAATGHRPPENAFLGRLQVAF